MASYPHRCATQKRRHTLVVDGFGCCARDVADGAACCFSDSAGLLVGAVSACAISRKPWTGIHRAQHAMRKIAKQLDPKVDVGLPDLRDRPPGMRWSRYNRLADRFEYQNTVWNLAIMNSLAFLLPRLRRRSTR